MLAGNDDAAGTRVGADGGTGAAGGCVESMKGFWSSRDAGTTDFGTSVLLGICIDGRRDAGDGGGSTKAGMARTGIGDFGSSI